MIIDTTGDASQQIVHLNADRITTVYRYLTSAPGSYKLVTPREASALGAAGIRLGLVYEGGGGAPGQTPLSATMGERDAIFVRSYVPLLGAPAGACIYFAADDDFDEDQVNDQVVPYFGAVVKVMAGSGYRIGAYGSGYVLSTLWSLGLMQLGWLSGSLGWTDSRKLLAARPPWLALVQAVEDTRLANLDCDTDYAVATDIGDFLPSPIPVKTSP